MKVDDAEPDTETEPVQSTSNADTDATVPMDETQATAEDAVPEPPVVVEKPPPTDEAPTETPSLESDDELVRTSKIERLKQRLTLLGAVTNRGQFASEAQRIEALKALTALEPLCQWQCQYNANGHREIMQQQEGRWTLILSDVELFRVSPFFMALEQALLEYPDRDEVRVFRILQEVYTVILNSEAVTGRLS